MACGREGSGMVPKMRRDEHSPLHAEGGVFELSANKQSASKFRGKETTRTREIRPILTVFYRAVRSVPAQPDEIPGTAPCLRPAWSRTIGRGATTREHGCGASSTHRQVRAAVVFHVLEMHSEGSAHRWALESRSDLHAVGHHFTRDSCAPSLLSNTWRLFGSPGFAGIFSTHRARALGSSSPQQGVIDDVFVPQSLRLSSLRMS